MSIFFSALNIWDLQVLFPSNIEPSSTCFHQFEYGGGAPDGLIFVSLEMLFE